ncbi:hypothetical protein [Flavobacterium sp.]|uniref:hypothetical protein n=1 Tax=Flavobacterium sp. TaxID=239 RepID=UPI003D0BEBAB
MKKICSLFLLSLVILSCSKDSESSITPTPSTPPSTDGKSHYLSDVAPIISNRCTGCHGNTPSNGAPMSLTTLDAVKEAIQNRGLISRINLPQGDPGMMPKNGTKLSQSDIDKITKWQTDGFLN